MFKNVNILEFGDDSQIHHEKCIKVSTHLKLIKQELIFNTFKMWQA